MGRFLSARRIISGELGKSERMSGTAGATFFMVAFCDLEGSKRDETIECGQITSARNLSKLFARFAIRERCPGIQRKHFECRPPRAHRGLSSPSHESAFRP